MLHKIGFSNIYTFSDYTEINFDSKSNVYVVLGPNCSGKSNLLATLEIVIHVLWDRPNYDNLHKIVNQNSDNQLMEMFLDFTFEGRRYTYFGQIDLATNTFSQQIFKYHSNGKELFKMIGDHLTSDYLTELQLELLQTFNIRKHGIFPYVNHIIDDHHVAELRAIKKQAKRQDYIDIDEFIANKSQNMKFIKTLMQSIQPDLVDLKFYNTDTQQYRKVQGTPVELKTPGLSHTINLDVVFIYQHYKLHLDQQSSGVKRLFEKCVELLATNSQLFFQPRLIDNFGMLLDEQLFKHLLNLYCTTYERQLIFTTHNLVILEDKLLPKESIIILNKDKLTTHAIKISDYKNIRSDGRHNWKRMYNEGKFK